MTQQNPESAASDSIRHLALAVAGMHCANCVGRVEHNLLRITGVRRATVNLVQERADIDYDAELTAPTQIIAAVHKAGYKAVPWQGIGSALRRERLESVRVIVCFMLSMPLLLEMLSHALGEHRFVLPQILALVLASVVQFWGGWPFYQGAAQALRNRRMNMDVLVAIGASIAYGTSVWRVVQHSPEPLAFEASALVITFVLLGRWVEQRVRRKTMATVHHLVTLQPQQVRRVVSGGAEVMVPLPEIMQGDTIVVWTGERLALDGEVTDGVATFDYAHVTGEAVPRVVSAGDALIAGALCLNGSVKVKVTSHAGQTVLDHLADMVAVAQASHPNSQRLADSAASHFMNIVLVFAVLTFYFWWFHGELAQGQQAALAVLLMACPCALGLAIPMVISTAVGQAARHGILLRDASALEQAAEVNTVIFDKTGTLSSGTPELAETVTFGQHSSDQILAYAAALNQKTNHPIASGIRATIANRSLPLALPALRGDAKIMFGRGVQGTLQDGTELVCGNLHYMIEHKIPLEDAAATAAGWEERGRSLSWVAALTPQPRLLGLMSFRDAIRPEAQEAVQRLLSQHYNLSIMSGDNKHTTLSLAKRLGIGHVIGEALPQDKLQEIQKRQKWGEIVAMVGDGMNDAPALASANLGIAVHGGVAGADAAAPIRLLRDDLRLVPAIFDLARAAQRVMYLNIWWAIIFNLVALPLAAMGSVPPYIAALSMSLSSILVMLQSLSLRLWRPHA